jgi:hypothetical protein
MKTENKINLFLICLLPVLLIMTNLTVADERIRYVCENDEVLKSIENCYRTGKDFTQVVGYISAGVIAFAVIIMYAYDKTVFPHKEFECWCQYLDWDKIIEQYPDQARIRDYHNCHIGEKKIAS